MTELLWNFPPKLLLHKGPPLKREAPADKADKKGNKIKKVGKEGGEGKAPGYETPLPKTLLLGKWCPETHAFL